MRILRLSPILLLALVAGCSSSSTSAPAIHFPPPTQASTIKHIVIIMQENRSFDNLFMGFPGADTVTSGMSKGKSVALQPIPLEQGWDLDHSHTGWWVDWDNGALDGFDGKSGPNGGSDYFPIPNLPYAYVPQAETAPYWTLAERYTLGDRMFQSNSGPSFVAHQYMIAGQSAEMDENPDESQSWGCDSMSGTRVALLGPNGTDLPGIYPCVDYQTMADLLDAKGVTWKYYAPGVTGTKDNIPQYGNGYVWSAYDAIKHIRFSSDWTNNVISPNSQFLTDIASGQLAQVTWIMPGGTYSDHAAPGATNLGPEWVATLTNAIGASSFWDSTVVFITWDDWGGWYDHVNPPQVDAMGLGFRVPLIIVSPYAKVGYISHTTHEFGGFLKYTEEVFSLPTLGTRDVNADDFSDCFDYTQTPKPYTNIPVAHTGPFFIKNIDNTPPDDD